MKKSILVEDLCDYKYISELKLSPDNSLCTMVVSQGDMKKNNYRHHLYSYNFMDRKLKQLTSTNERGIIWENNNCVLFPHDRDKAVEKAKANFEDLTSYYRLDLTGGEAQKAFSIPLQVNTLKFIDERFAVVIALKDLNKPDIKNLTVEEKSEMKTQLEEEKDYEVLDELPYWFNGRGFINKLRKQVYLVDTYEETVELLTPMLMDVHSFTLSEDKKTLIVVGNEYQDMDNQYSSITKIDLTTKASELLLGQEITSVRNIALIEDTLVFTATDFKKWGTSENAKFYKMDLQTKKIECFFEEDLSVGNTVGSDAKLYGGESFFVKNKLIYMVCTVDNASNIYTLSLDGILSPLTFKEGSVDCFDVQEEQVVFVGMRDLMLQEVYQVKNNKEEKLTTINTALEDKEVLPLEKLSFINSDNIRIDGWVIKPRNFDKTKQYPAVFDIHGGPKTVYGETFFHEMQVWASMGYFVMFCNPRGSDGRGNEFMHLVNKYGTVDYQDLMNFCDQVLQKYQNINQSKIAVTGGSYGGFMVNWIIGHTDRFCCAASQRSIANWISKSLTTDIGYYHNMSQMASTPWDNMERMWSFSPLKYADKATTPTLFIHSNEDYRCWMAEALQMFQALKIHRVDTRLCLFKNENHELSRGGKPKHRRRRLQEINSWFEQYCK